MTRSQNYAQAVYAQFKELGERNLDEKMQKQYGALCHRFPILVLRCGLAQAVGFLSAKGKSDKNGNSSPHGLLLQHLANQLGAGADAQAFQIKVNQASLSDYRRLTREALALAVWYKRYAESLLGVDASETGGE